jgi:two-component system LytT family response regulator
MTPLLNPLRAVVIDDDAFSRAQVELELRRHTGSVSIVGQCANGHEGAGFIISLKPDLVFLDVQMPGMDGFAMLDALPRRDFAVIFITSYEEYAIRAIRYSALDYLLKPIKPAELDAAIAHVIARRDQLPARVDRLLLSKPSKERAPDTLVIVTRKGDRHLRTEEIIRCEADRNYTWFHLRRGEKLLSSYPLSNYEEFLAGNEFMRVHRSHIVNARHVASCSTDGLLTMADDTVIEVSRRRKTEVVSALRGR